MSKDESRNLTYTKINFKKSKEFIRRGAERILNT
ncbi:MAG TPA: palindromic element RPE5 domain-containing protein [Rickettsia endosymbiont of Bembidion lapponicum]|nr:palindromic element RPE5 domain-containing protein [Rickettsia endosymbiont of Bembidion lapponicum]